MSAKSWPFSQHSTGLMDVTANLHLGIPLLLLVVIMADVYRCSFYVISAHGFSNT